SPFPDWGNNVASYPGQNMPTADKNDQRFLMSSGPFTLPNDSTTNVVVAVMVARDGDQLLEMAVTAQMVFDAGFKGPNAPEAVNFSAKGMDEQVLLYWDNSIELIPDKYFEDTSDTLSSLYNPAYREFDLEGYRIYRSRTGAGGTWELLAQYDLINEYTSIILDTMVTSYDGWDTTFVESILGTNTGVPYNYLDTNLLNGIAYHYKITGYDINYLAYDTTATGEYIGGSEILFLEGAGIDVAVIPRIYTSNYVTSSIDISMDESFETFDYNVDTNGIIIDSNPVDINSFETVIHPIDTSLLVWDIYPIIDTLMEGISDDVIFKIEFDGIEASYDIEAPSYLYTINMYNRNDDSFVDEVGKGKMNLRTDSIITGDKYSADTLIVWKRASSAGIAYKGIVFDIGDYAITYKDWDKIEDNIIVQTENYNNSIVKSGFLSAAVIGSQRFFRGSRLYRITWHEETINDSTNLTCEVWDMQNNLEIPFDTLDIGDCWHFSIYSSSVMDNVEYLN
ncbi:hypothetical protein KAU15_03790, partial [candidate division WOR-3 bacterium]|nr:hypothetical protein [candidate division WOR-3 bacterium]